MNVEKLAKQDAARWARAEMFFGEGAGTRRKLIGAEVGEKASKIPGYYDAFEKFYARQNWAEHAIKATKERAKLDRAGFIRKNTKALLRGDRRNEIVSLIFIGYTVHKLGYDKKALEKARSVHIKVRDHFEERRRLKVKGTKIDFPRSTNS